jgi:RHS repeat-associated protein
MRPSFYDGIYRLTNETIALAPSHNNGSVGYGLDPVGNRLTESSSLSDIPSGASTFNADDELSSESYDANGNVTAAGGKSFTYDSENRLVSMSAGGNSVSMVYDAFGNRVAKTVNGVTTQYLVESDLNPTGYPQVFDELNGSAVVTRTYTYGLQRISENLSPALTGNSTWTPSFYGYDDGGNVRQLTNSTGSVTDSYEYDAYGNHWTVDGSTPNNMLYRGEEWDPDLGLLYLRARYMNPLTGRFLSRDPEDGDFDDPATLHKYLYAGDDPVDQSDPTGRAYAIPAPAPKPLSGFEFALLIGLISIPVAEKSLPPIVCDINTLLSMGALGVRGYSEIAPDFPACSATGTLNAPPPPLPLPLPLPLPWFHPPSPKCDSGDDLHHLLPQQFRSWFAQAPREMNVDSPEFTTCLPRRCHTGSGGVHSNQNGPGTNWNALWEEFIEQNPNASPQQVLNFLAEMEGQFADLLNCP